MRKAQVTFNVSIALALTTLGFGVYINNGTVILFALLWILVDTIAFIAYTRQGKRQGKDKDLLDD